MRSPVPWDVARPERPGRLRGVTMAGFRDRALPEAGHRLIPHPSTTLVLDFGAAPPVVDDVAGHRHHGSMVAGPGLGDGPGRAVHVRGQRITAVQVRLVPSVARAVLGVAPAELDGAVTSLEDLWGRDAARLCERLADAPSWPQRFSLVEDALGRRIADGPAADPEIVWAWERIVTRHGILRVDHLSDDLGWSRKRLWSRFRAQIGLGPKRAASLIRFDRAVHRLAAGHEPARVAAETGYADQPHLHRDVTAFTGLTPRAAAREPFLAVDDLAWTLTSP